jgi:hypothetical protein
MAIDSAILMKFVRSLDPPLDVRIIDIYGRTAVIHAGTTETPEITNRIELCRWAQIGDGPTMLCHIFEDVIRNFELKRRSAASGQ